MAKCKTKEFGAKHREGATGSRRGMSVSAISDSPFPVSRKFTKGCSSRLSSQKDRRKMSRTPPKDKLLTTSIPCCHQVDPLQDPRWASLVENHPKASVFHSVGWLEALRSSYGYRPVVFTTAPPSAELKNGVVFCLVDSWLTGRRLVSLPFSDHCEPLCDSTDDLNLIIQSLQAAVDRREWKYLEIRPIDFNFGPIDGRAD